jgi:hypothetical protein
MVLFEHVLIFAICLLMHYHPVEGVHGLQRSVNI